MDLKPHQKRELLWQRSDLDKVLFDSNVKVPLLIVGNQIKENVIVSQQVRQVDIFPTLLDIIGIKNTEEVDGQSLVPLINGGDWKNYQHIWKVHHHLKKWQMKL